MAVAPSQGSGSIAAIGNSQPADYISVESESMFLMPLTKTQTKFPAHCLLLYPLASWPFAPDRAIVCKVCPCPCPCACNNLWTTFNENAVGRGWHSTSPPQRLAMTLQSLNRSNSKSNQHNRNFSKNEWCVQFSAHPAMQLWWRQGPFHLNHNFYFTTPSLAHSLQCSLVAACLTNQPSLTAFHVVRLF